MQKNAYVAGISGATVAGGVGVVVDVNGHLGTVTSSAKFKDDIQQHARADALAADVAELKAALARQPAATDALTAWTGSPFFTP